MSDQRPQPQPVDPADVERDFSDIAVEVRDRIEERRRIAAHEAAEAKPA